MKQIKQSETVTIKRSEINFAPYNPRKEDPKVVDDLKKNFKRVGFLGGVVWNEITGNLVSGHKRTQGLDIINKYDGTTETDYEIKVEKVSLDEKTEKEQNIFMNSQSVQGKFDNYKLADLIPDIDYSFAGLTDIDLNIISVEVPDLIFQSNSIDDINNDIHELERLKQEQKAAIKEAKRKQKTDTIEREENNENYIIVNFNNLENKIYFLESLGLNPNGKFVNGEKLLEMIERIE
jgi:hypothetical protein